MKSKDFERRMEKAIDKGVDNMKTRKVSLSIFTRLALDIRRRTRLGYGCRKWGSPRGKFIELSTKYKNARKKRKTKIGSILNRSKTGPSKSNLTLTGKMIDAFRAFFDTHGVFRLDFIENRSDGKTNSEVASYHEGKGRVLRPFINPSKQEVKRFKQDVRKNVKKQIIKELKKLK